MKNAGYQPHWGLRVLLCTLLMLTAAGVSVFAYFYGLMERPESSEKTVGAAADEPAHAAAIRPLDGSFRLLLMGTDDRGDTTAERTDAMVLVRIDTEARRITLSSFLRDIYLPIPCCGFQRLNAANVFGGPEGLIEALELNFETEIDAWACTNFDAFMSAVEGIGGVTLPLSEAECVTVNKWAAEFGAEPLPERAGSYTLSGAQALAFCRSRDLGSDYGRTERQRRVLSALWQRLSELDWEEKVALMEAFLPRICTNLSASDCLSLLLVSGSAADYELVTQQIPGEGLFREASIDGMSVLELDWEANRSLLRQ